jgi:hypothetical protein
MLVNISSLINIRVLIVIINVPRDIEIRKVNLLVLGN